MKNNDNDNKHMITGPILESKGMRAIFQKKGKKGQNILKFERAKKMQRF